MSGEATGGPLARLAHAISTARQLTQNMRSRELPADLADQLAAHLNAAKLLARSAKPGARQMSPVSPPPAKPEAKSQPTRRRILWRRDPRCFWCGRVTVFEAHGTTSAATIEHIYPRGHPRRQSTRKALPSTVLACYDCNQERGGYSGQACGPVCPVLKVAG